MIQRTNPDVGYIDTDVFAAFSFTQTIRAGGHVYVSGIAPLRGGLDSLEVVGADDMGKQMEFCFDVLRRCLEAEGLTMAEVVSHTLYATDLGEMLKVGAPVLGAAYGDSGGPTSAAVEVRALFHPQQLFEVSAIAYDPAR